MDKAKKQGQSWLWQYAEDSAFERPESAFLLMPAPKGRHTDHPCPFLEELIVGVLILFCVFVLFWGLWFVCCCCCFGLFYLLARDI